MTFSYDKNLQQLLNRVIESGMDEIVAEGEKIIIEIENRSLVISRKNGLLNIQPADSHQQDRLDSNT